MRVRRNRDVHQQALEQRQVGRRLVAHELVRVRVELESRQPRARAGLEHVRRRFSKQVRNGGRIVRPQFVVPRFKLLKGFRGDAQRRADPNEIGLDAESQVQGCQERFQFLPR